MKDIHYMVSTRLNSGMLKTIRDQFSDELFDQIRARLTFDYFSSNNVMGLTRDNIRQTFYTKKQYGKH